MIKLAFKGLLARKLRTVLTGFAVVLGVAFVAGTFVFTDTIDASFKDLFERTSKGTDVSVQSKLAVEADFAAPPDFHVRAGKPERPFRAYLAGRGQQRRQVIVQQPLRGRLGRVDGHVRRGLHLPLGVAHGHRDGADARR